MTATTLLADNGVTSGITGYQLTGGDDGTLQLQTTTAGGTATTAVTVDNSQQVTFAQAANLPNTFGFKNRIINGAMMIDQRNAGASVTVAAGGSVYTADRWGTVRATAGSYAVQQSTTAPSGFYNSLYFYNNTANTPASGDYNFFYQQVEGLNVADLGWGTASAQSVTISFQVRASATGTYGGSLRNSAGNRSYPFTFVINAVDTFETKTITIAGDTSGTWLKTNGIGIGLCFDLGSGASFRSTAGAWASGNYVGATGTSQNMTLTSGATFYITGVQLEKGSTATSFDFRSYGAELALCQRYFQLIRAGVGAPNSTTNLVVSIQPVCEMRTGPTLGQTGVLSISSALVDYTQSSVSVGSYASLNNLLVIGVANFTGLSGNVPYFLRALNSNSLTLSAEL
jgi:hypothetical protein